MKPDLLRGHLDAMILSVLEDGPRHGYAIMEALQRTSGGALDLPTGTLYPALRRLERAGCVHGEWDVVGGRRRRTYRLTGNGARSLSAERSGWRDFSSVVEKVLRPDVAGPSGA